MGLSPYIYRFLFSLCLPLYLPLSSLSFSEYTRTCVYMHVHACTRIHNFSFPLFYGKRRLRRLFSLFSTFYRFSSLSLYLSFFFFSLSSSLSLSLSSLPFWGIRVHACTRTCMYAYTQLL